MLFVGPLLRASDHADPIHLPLLPWELLSEDQFSNKEIREFTSGITDLFVFPVDEFDHPISFPQMNERRTPMSQEEWDKFHRLTFAQRADILKGTSRDLRKKALMAATPAPENEAMTASREEIALYENLGPTERLDWQKLKDAQKQKTKSLVLILCVRPRLPAEYPEQIAPGKKGKLELKPYEYKIHLDPDAPLEFDTNETDPMKRSMFYSYRARYGGNMAPENFTKINSRISFSFKLTDDVQLDGDVKIVAPDGAKGRDRIQTFVGLRDDPFIFPPFFRTNVVAMVLKVPIEFFGDQSKWAVWVGSYRDGKKLDHGGRSLRTQQPRFAQIWNEYEPKDQPAVFDHERAHPMILRDLLVKANIPTLFNFRNWDVFPDVMVYNRDYDCRYPNGRLLTDDVSALLAENGDGLLQEISYEGDTWPRRTQNDKAFLPQFPYLAAPWTPMEKTANPLPQHPPVEKDPLGLSWQNKLLIIAAALAVLVILVGIGVFIGKWLAAKKYRERYL
jgi:hypothetical protein